MRAKSMADCLLALSDRAIIPLEVGGAATKIIRTVFQDHDPAKPADGSHRLILVIDMEKRSHVSTSDIPCLTEKMEAALPGIFPAEDSPFAHVCGGADTAVSEHPFREEIARGTDIPHLLEHVLLHLLSRRMTACSAYCGQRSTDLERGITSHYYLVLDCPSKLEAVVAVDLGFKLVNSWLDGRTVTIDPASFVAAIRGLLEPMVRPNSDRPMTSES